MEFSLVIRQRLKELGTEQRDLAAAARVTESYVSQLVTGKKGPPAPERTDIYRRMETFLGLASGRLASLADLQRKQALQRRLADPPTPLFTEVRELILRKCEAGKQTSIAALFEKEPFSALERLVSQTLLDVVKRVARDRGQDEAWIQRVARRSRRSDEQMRVIVLELLEADVFTISDEHCATLLDLLIESWDIDLTTFAIKIVLNRRLAPEPAKTFEFVEQDSSAPTADEPGFQAFLRDPAMASDATSDEIAFLKNLKFTGRRPTALYYYRELQSLRDPLHFRAP